MVKDIELMQRDATVKRWIKAFRLPDEYKTLSHLNVIDADKTTFTKLQAIKDNIVKAVVKGCTISITGEYKRVGKTTWAISLAKAYFKSQLEEMKANIPAVYVQVDDMLDLQKAAITNSEASEKYNKLWEDLKAADLVIVDGLSDEHKLTDFEQKTLTTLFRLRRNKFNIITFDGRSGANLGDVRQYVFGHPYQYNITDKSHW